MSDKPKLYYFNARGRGEVIRLTFAAAGVEFEDIRFTFEEWGQKYKTLSPSGQAPFLECPQIGKLTQSSAIAKLLARKHNMMGADDMEYYRIERMVGQVDDIFAEVYKMHFAPDDKKAEMKKTFEESTGPKLIENLLKFKDESKSQFATGPKVTLGDLVMLCVTDTLRSVFPDLLKKFGKLEEHYQAVLKANEGLARYIKNRPVTNM